MNDLISRQAAIDEVVNWLKDRMTDTKNGKPLTDRLKDLPSAEPEIIRCKNCKHCLKSTDWKHRQSVGMSIWFCKKGHGCNFTETVTSKDYCSWAERRRNDG